MIFDKKRAKEIVFDIATNGTNVHDALTGIEIVDVVEEVDIHTGDVYWMGRAFKDDVSIGSISLKRSDVVEYIRENKLRDLGI